MKMSQAVDSSICERIDSLGIIYGENSDSFYFGKFTKRNHN